MKHLLFTGLLFFLVLNLNAQANLSDSSVNMHIVSFNFSTNLTGADMHDRFENANLVGLGYGFKWKNNFYFGIDGRFMFSARVKEKNMLDSMRTSSGYIITGQGLLEDVVFEERGFTVLIKAGKIFPVYGPNPNCGLFATGGIGFMQHQIIFNYTNGPIYQLEGNYSQGYDRLTNGLTLYESIGYQYFSNHNFGNFHIGFDFWQAFTQNRRSWNFDTMEHDSKKRLDLLFGINLGLDLPFYKRAPEEFYIN